MDLKNLNLYPFSFLELFGRKKLHQNWSELENDPWLPIQEIFCWTDLKVDSSTDLRNEQEVFNGNQRGQRPRKKNLDFVKENRGYVKKSRFCQRGQRLR